MAGWLRRRDGYAWPVATDAADPYTSGAYWARHADSDSGYKVRLLLSLLDRANLTMTPGSRLVEVGCGQGAFLLPLAALLRSRGITAELIGLDISPDAIDLARARSAGLGVRFEVGSAADVPDADFLFLMDVVEHVENPDAFLRELAGKTRYVALHLPVEHSFAHLLLNKPTTTARVFDHVHFYSMETSRLLIERSPFGVVAHQFSAAQWENVRRAEGPADKAVQLARFLGYRLAPTWMPVVAGGSVMWLLDDRAHQRSGPGRPPA
jgi:SAM-dependent methyltransferase